MLIGLEEKNYVDSILNELERTEVAQFVANKTLLEAVKKVLLIPIYHSGVLKAGEAPDFTRNFMLSITNRREQSDEQIGQQARAVAEAVAMLDAGLSYLEIYKPSEKVDEDKKKNPAR